MKKEIQLFQQYIKQYNLKTPELLEKYHHTFRVMNYCEAIAKHEGFSEEDIYIAKLCGLLHDIARFKQWTEYQTFFDHKSFDHGKEGKKILEKNNFIQQFTTDDKIIDIVLSSVCYHNQYEIPTIDPIIQKFIKIVRDADKFDIMLEQNHRIDEREIVLKKELLEDIYQQRSCQNHYVTNTTDAVLRILSWVFDLNFRYSYHFLLDRNILMYKFQLLELYGETEEITKLKNYITKTVKERLTC